jgi:hypothetical protein
VLGSTVTDSELNVGYLFKELLAPLTGPSRPFFTAVGWLLFVGVRGATSRLSLSANDVCHAALSYDHCGFACSPGANVHVSLASCCHSRSNIQQTVVESFPSYKPLGDKHLTVDTAMPGY